MNALIIVFLVILCVLVLVSGVFMAIVVREDKQQKLNRISE